ATSLGRPGREAGRRTGRTEPGDNRWRPVSQHVALAGAHGCRSETAELAPARHLSPALGKKRQKGPHTRSWAGAGQGQSSKLTETLIFDPDPQRSALAWHT